jgi:transglutaminase-like putative cysteine protease
MTVSIIGVLGVTLGMGLSYLIRMLIGNTKFAKWDGGFYCAVAWIAVIFARQLNVAIFPEDTFPIELTPSSWLLWMTIFGSFFAWRDGTLIFQSIPALAIFGFVGCYDTFKAVVILFFIFIICFATLFARAHGRDMQDRAVLSGYFSIGRNAQMNPEEQSTLLREGPWRWAAGAEWALGSALVIVVLSCIGAPVIQATAKPLSGFVNIRQPKLRPSPTTVAAQSVPLTTRVGTGPVHLGDTPYFEVTGTVPEYLRVGIYNSWNGNSWMVSDYKGTQLRDRMTGEIIGEATQEQIEKFRFPDKKPNEFSDEYRDQIMTIKSLISTQEIPQSGNDQMLIGSNSTVSGESGITLQNPSRYEAKLSYDKLPSADDKSKVPKILDSHLFAHISTALVNDKVRALATETGKGISSDYEKATAIKEKISRLIKYDTNCPSTPDNRDPVQYALFESHEGYCDLFASAMVQMARSVRIPARYAIGYLPDHNNKNSQGTQLLIESDRHAWAELYFENIGWVPFDATEGAEVVPGGGRKDNKPTDYNQVIRIVGLLINVLIAAAVIIGIALFIRIRRLPKTEVMFRSELDAEYISFIGSIWKFTGQRRLLSETTSEYLTRVGDQLGELKETANLIGGQFTSVMFGKPEIGVDDVAATRESVQNFIGLLKKMQKSR